MCLEEFWGGRYSEIRFSASEVILNRGDHVEEIIQCPFLSFGLIEFKERAFELNKCLFDDWLGLSLPDLYIHHLQKGEPSSHPLLRLLLKVLNTTHQSSEPSLDDCSCIQSQGVAVVAVKGSGEGASPFIAEVTCQGGELAFEISVAF